MQRTDLKNSEILVGNTIYLKQLIDNDVSEKYLNWLKDISINKYLESRDLNHTKESIRSFVINCYKSKNDYLFGIFTKEGQEHIGNIKLGDIDWKNKNANIGIIIGEKNFWGQGIASNAIKLIIEFAFQNLKLTSLSAGCYEENIASRKAFLKSGWNLSGKYPKWKFNIDGKLTDIYILTISRIYD